MEPGWSMVFLLHILTSPSCGSPLTARNGECWTLKTAKVGQRWNSQVGHGLVGWTKETTRKGLQSSIDRRRLRVVSSTLTSGCFAIPGSSGSSATPMVICALSGRRTRFQRPRVSQRDGMVTLPQGLHGHCCQPFVVPDCPLLPREAVQGLDQASMAGPERLAMAEKYGLRTKQNLTVVSRQRQATTASWLFQVTGLTILKTATRNATKSIPAMATKMTTSMKHHSFGAREQERPACLSMLKG